MLPEIAGKMKRDVLPLHKPRERPYDFAPPKVWKGIRRPLFARYALIK